MNCSISLSSISLSSIPLSLTTRLLHWSVALLMIGLTLLGYLMVKFEIWDLYALHKSLGVIALVLILPRAIIRLGKGWPTPVRQYPVYEALAAKAIHWGLLVSTLLIPVSGLCYSGAAGRGVALFGWFIIPMNPDINDPANVIPYSESIRDIAHAVHVYLPYIMLVLLLPLMYVGGYWTMAMGAPTHRPEADGDVQQFRHYEQAEQDRDGMAAQHARERAAQRMRQAKAEQPEAPEQRRQQILRDGGE